MFGYILLNRKDSTKEEKKKYRDYYCGLCRALNDSYGYKGTSCLSFDMTFLYLILSDLYNHEEKKTHVRCMVHPAFGRDIITTDAAAYCADMQILLSYFSAEDNIRDNDNNKAKKVAANFEKKIARLKEKYPRQYAAIANNLVKLEDLEKKKCQDIAAVSACFADLLGEIFVPYEDIWSEKLRSLGKAVGCFIYIMDAFDDISKDEKNGNYNPLTELKHSPSFKEEVREMLTFSASNAADIMEKLPLDENLSILRNILYSGIWAKFEVKNRL